jgi:hypothetical protein
VDGKGKVTRKETAFRQFDRDHGCRLISAHELAQTPGIRTDDGDLLLHDGDRMLLLRQHADE